MRQGIERREELRREVAEILDSEVDGRLARTIETQSVDFKEEAGRRIRGELQPGQAENTEAATKLADEVACLANTPGGGALIVGVEDGTGNLLGTELDCDWLRRKIHQAVDVAPDIAPAHPGGHRVLVVLVAEAPQPVEDTSGRLRWRVGDSCQAVDRSEWWQHRNRADGRDPLASVSVLDPSAVSASTLTLIRRHVDFDPGQTDREILRSIGAVDEETGNLTQAAAILLVPSDASRIEMSIVDVVGGEVLNRISPDRNASLLEQIDRVESAIDAVNPIVSRRPGFAETPERRIPSRAIREAVLNGLIHRDWYRNEPTDIRWIDADSTLVVRSPGGFTGGVSADNVLSARHARYPSLADLFRALHLVDKQGFGVDRMYRLMISRGHQPPRIVETSGDHITCTLVGGPPVFPVLEMVESLRPDVRQRDIKIVMILHLLLHRPFIDRPTLIHALQTADDPGAADLAVRAALQTTLESEPIIAPYKDVWILGPTAWALASRAQSPTPPVFLEYASTDTERLSEVVDLWLDNHESVTTGDLVALTRVSRGTAKRALDELEGAGLRKTGAGRSVRYVPMGDQAAP